MTDMKETRKKYDMLTDNPGKSLLFFVLPMILGNLFQQFYNITDSVVVGKFVGEQALAAVGASYAITNVFIAIAIGGGIGSSVVISQFLGAGKLAKMKTAVYTTMFNFLGIAAFLAAVGLLFNNRILNLVNVPEDIFSDAALYLAIYFLGLPFLFMYNVQASIFNALGDSKKPLYLLIFSSLLNIVLDMILVIIFKQGVRGVALATLIAQGISAVISFLLLMRKLKGYPAEEPVRLYSGEMAVSMVKIATAAVHRPYRNPAGPVCDQQLRFHGDRRILRGHADRVLKHRANARHGKCHVNLHSPEYGGRKDRPGEGRLPDVLCDRPDGGCGALHNVPAGRRSIRVPVP